MPYLQNAGIPTLDGSGQPLFYNPPVSFITNVLSADTSCGYLALLKQAGCRTMAAIEDPAGETGAALAIYLDALGAAAKRFGIDYKGEVTVPASAPDRTPYATEAANKGAQCLEMAAGTVPTASRQQQDLLARAPLPRRAGSSSNFAWLSDGSYGVSGIGGRSQQWAHRPGRTKHRELGAKRRCSPR